MELLKDDISEIVERIGDIRDRFSGKTVLLTGGKGFLGRYFMEVFSLLNKEYLSAPCNLVILDNLITAGDFGENIDDSHHTFIQHDVCQPFSFDAPVDYVLHAAGIASPFYYRAYPLQTLDVAVNGTRNMLELAREKGSRLVFMSSSEIYGDPDPRYVPTPESYRGNVSCLGPRACYDESKRLGETLCQIYHNQFGLETNMVRPFNVYGPGMQEKDYRVMPNFASRIKKHKPLRIYGTGNQTRTFCYITDAIVGFLKVLVRGVPGEPYNIGNPEPEISMLELAREMERVLDRNLDISVIGYPDSYPADEPNRRCPDITKAELQLDYSPVVSLSDGLQRFLSWTDRYFTGDQ